MKSLSAITHDNNQPTLLIQPLIEALQKSQDLSCIIRLPKLPRGFKQVRRQHVNNLTRPKVIAGLLSGHRYAFVGSSVNLVELAKQ